jgi:serine/threonine protein kinase
MHDHREAQPSHALLRTLQEDLPSIQYLALHQVPDFKCHWVFDFKNYVFLTPAKQKSFRPLIVAHQADKLEMQCSFYENTLEYIYKLDNYLITCRTEKEFSNIKLLELALKHHHRLILSVKPDVKAAKTTQPKTTAKTSQSGLSGQDLQTLLNDSEYEIEKELGDRSYLLSYKLKHKLTGQKWVLKCPTENKLTDYPQLATLNQTNPAPFSPFQAHAALADKALIRPFIEAVSLSELVKRMNKLSGLQTWLLLVKMSKSLLSFHVQGQPHGNLIPTNILIDRTKQVFLTDQGMNHIHTMETPHAESSWVFDNQYFLAPEYLKAAPTMATDSYALGAMAAYMLSGHSDFFARLIDSSEAQRSACLIAIIEKSLEERHNKLLKTLRALLNTAPAQRPSIEQMTRQLLQESEVE